MLNKFKRSVIKMYLKKVKYKAKNKTYIQMSCLLLESLNSELSPAIAMSNLDVATKKKLNKRKLNS